MSSRAESLDEERKKAEVSLEGLKKKLKSLEEVIKSYSNFGKLIIRELYVCSQLKLKTRAPFETD